MRLYALTTAFFTSFALAVTPASSQQGIEAKAQTIKDTLMVLCLAGGSVTTVSARGDAELRSKIKDILTANLGATATAGMQFSKQTWEGIIGGNSKEMTDIQSQQANEARKCMVDHGFNLLSKVLAEK